jgi:hypothetical protein
MDLAGGPRPIAAERSTGAVGRDYRERADANAPPELDDQAVGGAVEQPLVTATVRGDAVGHWIRVDAKDREVIGVVEDGKYSSLRETVIPFMFLPSPSPRFVALWTAGVPMGLSEHVRRTLTQAAPQLRVVNFVTMKQNMQLATYLDRTAAAVRNSGPSTHTKRSSSTRTGSGSENWPRSSAATEVWISSWLTV